MSTDVATLRFTQTSIGQKLLMAVTGAVLVLFVMGHMVGNLQIYAGPAALNAYGRLLHSAPAVLWGVRVVLLLCLAVHVCAATITTLQSWRGRPLAYRHRRQYVAATLGSRTMRWSGVALLVYAAYHVLHLTFGWGNTDFVPGDVYHNVVVGLSSPVPALVYLVAMVFLGLHLVHGVWSVFQTMGLSNQRWNRRLRLLSATVTAAIVTGNVSIPIAVLAGWLR